MNNQDLTDQQDSSSPSLPTSAILFHATFLGLEELQKLRPQLDAIFLQYLPFGLYLVALHEALTNAVKFGTIEGKVQPVHVTIRLIRQRIISVRIKDWGSGFNGNERLRSLRKNLSDSFEQQLYATCGRGLPIMLASSDYICYNQTGNEVLLAKRL